MKFVCLLSFIALTFVSCSGGGGGNSGASGTIASPIVNGNVPASQVELQAIQQTLKSNPDYPPMSGYMSPPTNNKWGRLRTSQWDIQ